MIIFALCLLLMSMPVNGMEIIADPPYDAVDTLEWEDVTEENNEDLWYLTRTICGEAQNCGYDESMYVGSVILNRRDSDRFPNTIKEVVLQPGQYTCWSDGNAWKEPTKDNFDAAKKLLEDGSIFPADIVWQSKAIQGSYVFLLSEWGHYYCGG